jgi:hypothetical protein
LAQQTRLDKLEQRVETSRQHIHDIRESFRESGRDIARDIAQTQQSIRRAHRQAQSGLDRVDRGRVAQALHALARSEHAAGLKRHTPFAGHELQVFSQNGEDGILLHVFDRIGTANRRFVEIGAGGLENNTNNLFFNFGWSGFWIDMDDAAMTQLAAYVARNHPALVDNYRIHVGKVLPDTVDALVADYCRGEDPDLLTIDVDSFDGQVLRAIACVRPRVLGCEYNAAFGLNSVMVPFSPDFARTDYHRFYYGASLPALTRIAADKGYALIGCDSHGVNCFFIRDDLVGDAFRRLTPEEAYVPNRRYALKADPDAQWRAVADFPLETV